MTLNWRTVTTLELTDKLIADPNAGHNKLDQLQNVRVAIEGGFLHVDPRQPGQHAAGGYDVFLVPGAAVRSVVYRQEQQAEPEQIEVQVY
ncbi:hypothetical protein ABZ401_05980 [Streptomyces sp. NPDC005892]|uniref:hypothetical protein n=1 Tax=Streptomyces sp. NPDC005892 TaxID=3155593 RepID=UPI0033F564C9